MSRLFFSRYFIWGLVALFLSSCVGLDSQDLAKIFKDGKIPPVLLRLANQIHELPRHDLILKRVAVDQANKGKILPVAIMDSGVDIAHVDLIQKIQFEIKDGKIVGAGFDAMGKDAYGASSLVNPSLFAFGAKEIQDGVIVEPPKQPLELMAQMNDDFMKNLIERIKKNPKLNASLFSKIKPDSMSIFAAHELIFSETEKFDPKQYQENVKDKKNMFGLNSREEIKKMKELSDTDAFFMEYFYRIYDSPWKMDPDSGLPGVGKEGVGEFGILLNHFEHADLFFEELQAAYNETDKKWNTKTAIENYEKYGLARGIDEDDSLKRLHKALYFKTFGISATDDNRRMQNKIVDFAAKKITKEETRQLLDPIAIDEKSLKGNLNDALKLLDVFAEFIEKNLAVEDEEIAANIKKYLEQRGTIKNLVDWWAQSTNLTTQNTPNIEGVSQNEYVKLKMRSNHPYVDPESNIASHGTHVAGIVQKQNENIRIVPVRVTTQSITNSKKERAAQKLIFMKNFEEWLADPVVYRAMQATFQDQYPQLKNFPETIEGRKALAKEMMKILKDPIDAKFRSESLNHQFVEEVQDAIKYIGSQKIKIANISLGTEFNFPVLTAADSKSAPKLYDFLEMEFFKFQVAKTMKTEAPNTLFVVAAGNSGKWIDGKSKSAIPMDLSSPLLEEFENAAKGELAPNNHINNVLAVGSLNSKAELSSFTNIPIGVNTPFILAHGEQILSPIRSLDQSAINSLLEEALPSFNAEIFAPELIEDEFLEKFAKELGYDFSKIDEDEKSRILRNIKDKITSARDIFAQIRETTATNLFLAFPNHRARFSGTSMASPEVSGILSDNTIKKAEKLGIPLTEIYDHPEFTPEKIIDEAFEGAKSLLKGKRVIPLHALLGNKTYDETLPAQDLAKFMTEIETAGKGKSFKDGLDCPELFGGMVKAIR